MEGETVLYDGRVVPKEGFRVFIYGTDNQVKLVESWNEYESHISSGIWFYKKQNQEITQQTQTPIDSRKKKERK